MQNYHPHFLPPAFSDFQVVAGGIGVHNCHRADELCMTHDRIEVIDVVAKGTVEDRVRTRLREKAGMLGEFVRDPRLVKTLLGGLK